MHGHDAAAREALGAGARGLLAAGFGAVAGISASAVEREVEKLHRSNERGREDLFLADVFGSFPGALDEDG